MFSPADIWHRILDILAVVGNLTRDTSPDRRKILTPSRYLDAIPGIYYGDRGRTGLEPCRSFSRSSAWELKLDLHFTVGFTALGFQSALFKLSK